MINIETMLRKLSTTIYIFEEERHPVTELDRALALGFTNAKDLSYYLEHREATKPAWDTLHSKISELVMARRFSEVGWPEVQPDMEIHPPDWEPDLLFSQKDPRFPDCALKTCLYSDTSWVFQRSDKLHQRPNSSELVVGTRLLPTDDPTELTLHAILPWKLIKQSWEVLNGEDLLESMWAPHLRATKQAVYHSRLTRLNRLTLAGVLPEGLITTASRLEDLKF